MCSITVVRCADEEQPEELELINDVEGVYAYGTLQVRV